MLGGGMGAVGTSMCKLVGERVTAITAGPCGSLSKSVRAAADVIAVLRTVVAGVGNREAVAAPTAVANTRGAITTTHNAELHPARVARWGIRR